MNGNNGATAKLLIIGVGAVFLYAQFGPIGIIGLGLLLMLMN